jgi:hypothetical protein
MLKQLSISGFNKSRSEFSPGPAPFLQWIKVGLLVVDSTYQREIGRRGRANVHHIAENFDWSKFAPVIVAPVEGGKFAVVDGQHRTTAAMLRGVEEVPCQVVQADRAKQAAAFAAVNGNITKTGPHQIHHARLAARDPEALAVADVCAAAEVTVIRRNIVASKMEKGQTLSVGALHRCLAQYGRDTLITALQCVTQTSDGNAGFLRSTIIEALCLVLHENKHWRDSGSALLQAMDKFSFPDTWSEIAGGRDQIFPNTAKRMLGDKVRKFLSRRLGSGGLRQAA